ncbi:hypothetical protein LX32DRAFT_260949 [Colletotrichum zoysiae]|uniref:Uncharacterized protein n=1 Tax=Colletotrichum zoysiae TaxID=1216348 RepID=A0AAD9LUU6_9PEZI|nr:hypothetical protein LX32DRAFT_260949 [Colletotrichum zoysiae]
MRRSPWIVAYLPQGALHHCTPHHTTPHYTYLPHYLSTYIHTYTLVRIRRGEGGGQHNIQDTRLLTFNAVSSHCAPGANYINTGSSANGPQPISTDVARLRHHRRFFVWTGPSDAYPSREKQRQNPCLAPGFVQSERCGSTSGAPKDPWFLSLQPQFANLMSVSRHSGLLHSLLTPPAVAPVWLRACPGPPILGQTVCRPERPRRRTD